MDMKKEIKLSDLFKRGPKKDDAAAPEVDAPVKEPKPSRFKRGKTSDGEPKQKKPKAEKGPKEPRRKRSSKGAAVVPQVPLMRAFNLMPSQDERAMGDSRRPSAPQLGIAVAGLVILALMASMFLIANARTADKQQTLNELKTQLADLNVAAVEPIPQGPDALLVQERDQRTGALSTALGSRVAWDRFMRNLSLVLPDDVWLAALDAHSAPLADATAGPVDPNAAPTSESAVEITGYTRKQESVAQLLSRLGVLPEVASVKLGSATATKIGDEAVIQFIISATLKPAGAAPAAVTP
jgi:Tfp pilus assembly protein PilN